MKRFLGTGAMALAVCGTAWAQAPDFGIRADVRLTYRAEASRSTSLRWYDPLGRRSIVGFQLGLEPGLKAVFTERLVRLPNDGDPDNLDEGYVESPGDWKLGKQLLPFGQGRLVREHAVAAESETFLFLSALPMSIAAVDDARRRPRGVVGRIGPSQIGASFAIGDHWGTSGETLGLLRRPEQIPGATHGYHRLYGIDGTHSWGAWRTSLEYVTFREAETKSDGIQAAMDAALEWGKPNQAGWLIGFSQGFNKTKVRMIRVEARLKMLTGVYLDPLVRFRDGKAYDGAIELRLRF